MAHGSIEWTTCAGCHRVVHRTHVDSNGNCAGCPTPAPDTKPEPVAKPKKTGDTGTVSA